MSDRHHAQRAFRRRHERGDPSATNKLGLLLAENGDLDGAEMVWRQGDELGHAGAANNLGYLREQSGDLAAAEAYYRRSEQRGYTGATNNLGVVLKDRGDLEGAEAAWLRGVHLEDAKIALDRVLARAVELSNQRIAAAATAALGQLGA